MHRKVEFTEYVCDGCGKVFNVDLEGHLPPGFHGRVTEIASGGVSADWFACRGACIRKAVNAALLSADLSVEG